MNQVGPDCQLGDHATGAPAPTVAALERPAQIFRALGDPARLRIVVMLSQREMCVTELVACMGEKFATVSQRLRVLHLDGLIRRRRDGNHIYYAITDRHVADLISTALAHAEELGSAAVRPENEGE